MRHFAIVSYTEVRDITIAFSERLKTKQDETTRLSTIHKGFLWSVLIFLICSFSQGQNKNGFSLDTVSAPLKFKVKVQQFEGEKKKKVKAPFTITFTKDSIQFEGGHYITSAKRAGVYYYVSEKLNKKDVWKEVFTKDPLAYGYWGYYRDQLGLFRFYVFYSPKKNKYELYFSHTVTNSMFGMERKE